MIRYDVSSEKAHALKNNSVDLITVEQTLHWFDVKTFFAEAERVLNINFNKRRNISKVNGLKEMAIF